MRCAKREPGRSWEAIESELNRLGQCAALFIDVLLGMAAWHTTVSCTSTAVFTSISLHRLTDYSHCLIPWLCCAALLSCSSQHAQAPLHLQHILGSLVDSAVQVG